MKVREQLYHYGDQELIRPQVVLDALKSKRFAQQYALTWNHPASQRFCRIEQQMSQAEYFLTEQLCPGRPVIT